MVKLFLKFTDWGTAVKMPRGDEAKRRMTLHGPGTAGYIAPDTRGPTYDYQVRPDGAFPNPGTLFTAPL